MVALSQATVVVDAGSRLGALHTGFQARLLGRSLGAVPGPVTSAAISGTNGLLRDQSARFVTGSGDVRQLLNENARSELRQSREFKRTMPLSRATMPPPNLQAFTSREGCRNDGIPPFICEDSKAESTTDLAARFAVLGRFTRRAKLSDRCLCPGIVNLLRSTLRHWPERGAAGDLVAVAVGSDHSRTVTPTSHCVLALTLREERLHPIGCFNDSLVNECISALLDQLASLIERLPHFWAHDAVCVWD